jgi:hypothetical protein
LVYAVVVAFPVGAWQRTESIFLSFITPLLSIVLEYPALYQHSYDTQRGETAQ